VAVNFLKACPLTIRFVFSEGMRAQVMAYAHDWDELRVLLARIDRSDGRRGAPSWQHKITDKPRPASARKRVTERE